VFKNNQIKNGFLSFTKKNKGDNVDKKSNSRGERRKTSASGSRVRQWSSQSSTCSTNIDCESLHSLSSSSSYSSLNQKTSWSPRKRVSFKDDKTQWNIVESYVQYSSDLWWSKDEMRQRRLDMSSKALVEYGAEELCQMLQYAETYHSARQLSKVSSQPQQIKNNQTTESCTMSRISISSEEYKIIVQGKAEGWEGLERHIKLSPSLNCDTTKMMNRQAITKQVVQAYVEMTFLHNVHPNASARKLRMLSKSLTSFDRSWAVIMGSADRDALLQQ
jgi:hypothetical protein